MYKRLSAFVTGVMILALVITGCTSQASNIGLARENDQNTIGTDFVVAEAGSYDSADTAVVLSTDFDNGSITFMNIATGKQYTLSYDGTTYVKDRYEGPMSMSQIKEGDIVDITFLRGKKKLASVQLSPQSWVYDNIENYDLGGMNRTATIGSGTYSLPDQVVVLSDGRRVEVMDIVNKDILTFSGIDHEIYSIKVQKGHGYLSNGNAQCTKEVTIERDKEVVLDVGDLEIIADKTGKILFSVNPSEATVNIDGEAVDISQEVELTYGIHRISLEAEGYQSLTKYIQVGSAYASISFTLEAEEEKETEDEDENSKDSKDSENSGESSEVENAVTGNRVYIDGPQDVEVYLDGNYIGISPVNFKKVTGSHTITLRKTGYQAKSYTVYLYDDGQDITYSFTDLEPEYYNDTVSGNSSSSRNRTTSSRGTTEYKDTVSGNTVSGNEMNENDNEE